MATLEKPAAMPAVKYSPTDGPSPGPKPDPLDKPRVLRAAMEHANSAECSLRHFRGEIDRVAYQFPEAERAGIIEAADEATKILARVFKIQEAVRKVAVGS